LSSLITEKIGDGWIKDLDKLRQIEPFAEDPEFRARWRQIKQDRKQKLAEYILRSNNLEVDPSSLFDVQIKRIHEYKRQLLCAMHMIALYNRVKANPDMDLVPRTFIFGGKAAPGYFVAKMVVKLINSVGEVINNDPDMAGRLKVVFLANYSVSLGQFAYPAADLSEQISTAGKEASGTGNMKFSMNGALTIGTLDGANVEIREEVGAENFFLFGLTAQEVMDKKAAGYKPTDYYHSNPVLKQVIDQMGSGFFSPKEPGLFMSLVNSLLTSDEYMLLADFQAYLDCQDRVSQAFRDQDNWARMSILNVARMGKFSSDRTIAQYCQEIWKVEPMPIDLGVYSQETAGLKVTKLPE
jgi:starch phosphorylase